MGSLKLQTVYLNSDTIGRSAHLQSYQIFKVPGARLHEALNCNESSDSFAFCTEIPCIRQYACGISINLTNLTAHVQHKICDGIALDKMRGIQWMYAPEFFMKDWQGIR